MAQFELAALPYAPEALAPAISAETLSFHHGKHLQTYVNNLNSLVEGTPFAGKSLEEIVAEAPEGGILNNAGQILNHNLYFAQFKEYSEDNSIPEGKFREAVERDFGSVDAFIKEFSAKAAGLFGSGWAWLSLSLEGKLVITQESNAGNPLRKGLKPLLTFDVWEHAYYIDCRNRRADHIASLWNIIDWKVVQDRMS